MSTAPLNRQEFRSFKGDFRCPICNGAEDDPRHQGRRCTGGMSQDGMLVVCTRVESAKASASATGGWSHKMKGACSCGVEHGPAEPKPPKVFPKIESYFVYKDEAGTPRYRVARSVKDSNGGKTFYQQRYDVASNGFKGGKGAMKGVGLLPFRLPELIAADPAEPVFIAEGEKNVLDLVQRGAVSTCNAGGSNKDVKTYAPWFKGRNAVVLVDNDDPGRKHGQRWGQALHGVAASVKVLELPGLPEKGDVSDFLAGGGTLDQIRELAAAAPEWAPVSTPATAAGIVIPWADVARADDPFTIAEIHRAGYKHDGDSTLAYHRGEFFDWRDSAWRAKDPKQVRAEAARTTHDHLMTLNAAVLAEKDRKKASAKMVNDVLMGLESLSLIDGGRDAPCWLGDEPFPASEVLPCRNALVHLPSLVEGKPAILEPTPRFFCHYALDYDFDEGAPRPDEWLRFLDTIWPNDAESIATLQDWFGHCLTADTSHQKILGMIGPRRSGKGTIARVLTAMVGKPNVAGPTLSGLATNFGCSPLIGKPLAIIADARLSGRADQAVITERLLSISGEDSQTIDRKHKPAWTGKLPTRFVVISNELPRLNDASGALVGRMVILRFIASFYGKEDRGLEGRLMPELPGILSWSIEGWRRLNRRGHFIQPASGQELVDQMNDLSSPVGQFVRERCDVIPGEYVVTSELFNAWKQWCDDNGRDHPGTAQNFARDLTAAVTSVRTSNTTQRGGTKGRFYDGICLKPTF